MLRVAIPLTPEGWDEEAQEFVPAKEQILQLEHSLISISKWESKWCKPFIATKELTEEETIDYIRCMTLTQNVPADVYDKIPSTVIQEVSDYIKAPMTATWFPKESGGSGSREVVTSELIYYWMIALNIPVEFQKWHLNRLLTLIKVCNIKNTPPKKMKKSDLMRRNKALNEARRKQFNTNG